MTKDRSAGHKARDREKGQRSGNIFSAVGHNRSWSPYTDSSMSGTCLEASKLFSFVLGGDHFLAAVKTRRADVMTTMHLTSRRFDGDGRIGQKVMSTMITALARRFFILLNSHF